MSPDVLRGLLDEWRSEAIMLARRGALVPAAPLLNDLADQLERAAFEFEGEALTLDDAARESGFSAQHLRRLLRVGTLRDAAQEGPPRIRRVDLPRKARKLNGPGA